MKIFLIEFDVVPLMDEPNVLLCDNNRATTQAQNPISHQKTTHYSKKISHS